MTQRSRFPRARTIAIALIALGGVAAAQGAPPPGQQVAEVGPIRSGFTRGLDLGFGLTNVDNQTTDGVSGGIHFGGFVIPRLAISVRISGTTFDERGGTLVNGFAGLRIQGWLASKLFVVAGAGVGIITDAEDALIGPGLTGGAGYEIWQSKRDAFHLALEIFPVFSEFDITTSIGFLVGWQRY